MTPNIPKMSRRQAKLFWDALSFEERKNFNKLMDEMRAEKLRLGEVTVDENENIMRVALEPKNRPGQAAEPFYKHFKPIITGI